MAVTTKPPRTPRTPKGKKPRGASNAPWWEQAEEVPRAGLDDAEQLSRKAKRWRRIIWASICILPFSLIATFFAMAGVGTVDASAAPTDKYQDSRPAAIVAVERWLASQPAPLPGGRLVDWQSATSKKVPGEPDDSTDDYVLQVHRLSVADPAGNLFDTTVQLAVSDLIGAAVVGEPTLIPQAPAGDPETEPWPGMQSATASESVESAIAAWASAYTSGDPAELRLAVGDPSPSHGYVPLVGASLTDQVIGQSVGVWPKDASYEEREADPAKLVVRVSYAIEWASAPAKGDQDLPLVTFDLLVDKANTAAPVVVAWGGAGTGPSLKPYANSVAGRDFEAAGSSSAAESTKGQE